MTTLGNIYNSQGSSGVSNLGTPIVKKGDSGLDKNAFLKILCAELSNQDPTQNIDSTQYISQLATFTSLEQMQNLNATMTNYANNDLVGKAVTVSDTNSKGEQYTVVIQAVNRNNNKTTVSMTVNEDGKNIEKEFPIENIVSVVKIPDYTLSTITNLNGNMTFLLASSFIGKDVQVIPQDENGKDLDPVKGLVKGTYKENGTIMVTVELESGETKSYSYDRITKVGQN